jgi:predicted MFS family arabinose efflux permease
MPLPLGTQLRVVVPFAMGYYLSYLYRVVNAVMAPRLTAEVDLGPSDLGLLTAAYFIAFASSQLPLGVLLDRYGPRRIEALLLVVAALGAFVFAGAHSALGLMAGRALIGFGVSACLMAAFKAFVVWFPREQWPLINGLQMAAGGLGALSATAPVEVLLGLTDWRGIFLGLGVLTLGVAVAVLTVVPKSPRDTRETGLVDQVRGMRTVFASREFWRIAPWTVMSQASFMAIQGLWAGPWLRDVAGLDQTQAAATLMWAAIAMIAGFLSLGTLAAHLSPRGIRPGSVAAVGMAVFMGVQVLVTAGFTRALGPLWFAFGLCGTSGILAYAELSQQFPPHLAGRVNTGLNLLVFIAAFGAQWGMGTIIGLWPGTGSGFAPEGYRAALAVILALQAAGAVCFLLVRSHAPTAPFVPPA